MKRAVDRFMPRTGIGVCVFFGAVALLMLVAPAFPKPGELTADGLASLAAAGWCWLNFWRCRHAHCALTAPGWSALAAFDFGEAAIGHSLIHGDEQLVFLGMLVVAVAFEIAWSRMRGTNALIAQRRSEDVT
ncbi:MAG: hypothetical protein ACREOY_11120 [Candidatus Dormibacteraceae bacterium]